MNSKRTPIVLTTLVIALLAVAGLAYAFGFWPWHRSDRAGDISPNLTTEAPADRTTAPDLRVEKKSAETTKSPPSTKQSNTAGPTTGLDIRTSAPAGGTHFRLPDGTFAPCLNGIHHAPPMQWPRDVPWSTIRRKIVDRQGKEWYEHADGSYSTTEMMYRSDLGHSEPVVQVRNPVPVVPMEKADDKKVGPRAQDPRKQSP
ncbi:MAG: hypothetical protein KDC95_18375 [Planctomycetes bacterium]|nr:hypothetical protein [Planctomycetota bacterium]